MSTEEGEKESYIGLTANTFKQRLYGHNQSFKSKIKKGETTLSQHIWELKDNKKEFKIKYNIIGRASPFSPISSKCNLCTLEKYLIIFKPELGSLNNRNELGTHCRHKNKMLLIPKKKG